MSAPSDRLPLPAELAGDDAPVDPSEDALVVAAQGGDVRALEALLERHESRVLRVLRFLGIPGSEREDVAQEIFVRVFRHLDGFRRGRPFGAWIYRVTVNAAHDWRQRNARVAAEEVAWSDVADRAVDQAPSPLEEAERDGLRRRLEAGLAALTERERVVFVLREVEGLETREVARALGITSITVRRHLGLARDRLRDGLAAAPTARKNAPR